MHSPFSNKRAPHVRISWQILHPPPHLYIYLTSTRQLGKSENCLPHANLALWSSKMSGGVRKLSKKKPIYPCVEGLKNCQISFKGRSGKWHFVVKGSQIWFFLIMEALKNSHCFLPPPDFKWYSINIDTFCMQYVWGCKGEIINISATLAKVSWVIEFSQRYIRY